MSGATLKDIPATQFVTALAAHFKKTGKYELPAMHDLIKTGSHRELPPQDADWYYLRLASVARKVYLQPAVGIEHLAHAYGGKYWSKMTTKHHGKAARGNVRHALKALESTKLIAKKEGKTGRFITAAGRRELDVIANSIAKATKA
jgi:small subunit ribosomal protein S19e